MVGQVLISIDGTAQAAAENFLAVLTENGRDYWVLHLQIPPATEGLDQSINDNFQAFEAIIASARDSAFRDATPADYARVDLPDDDPTLTGIDRLGPRSPRSPRIDEPVTLVPVDGIDALRYFRVRAVPDAGIDRADHPLSPAALLGLQFRRTMNRPAAAGEVVRETMAGRPAWRVTFAAAPAGPSISAELVRQLWYTRSGPGQALLIEVVAEPEGLKSCLDILPHVVEALARGAGEPAATAPAPAFEAAEERGVAIAKAIRLAAVGSHQPGWAFYRIDMADHPIGYRIDQRLPAPAGQPRAIAGNHSVVIYNQFAMSSRWQLGEDGRQFRWRQELQTRDDPAQARAHLIQQELTFDGNRLVMRDLESGKEVWTATLPDSYLGPMFDDLWAPTADADGPAIVWVSPDGDPPAPFVFEAERASGGGTTLVRRALTAMDADEARFDSSGRLLHSDIYVRGNAAGEAVRAFSRVERSDLIAAFPRLKDELGQPGPAGSRDEP
jgi:hypothetical protein